MLVIKTGKFLQEENKFTTIFKTVRFDNKDSAVITSSASKAVQNESFRLILLMLTAECRNVQF